ncbi:MAG: hypothetical protein AB7H96_03325 [Vicinamibacterales bacterium]
MRILICGDSHCNSYQQGVLELGPATPPGATIDVRMAGPSGVFSRPFHERLGTAVRFRPEVFYLEELARRLPQFPLSGSAGPFDWYGFSGPLHLLDATLDAGLYHRGKPFRSRALLERVALDHTASWLTFLRDAVGVGLPVFVLESPLLFRTSPLLAEQAARIAPEAAAEVDNRLRSTVCDALQDAGVLVVRVPDRATVDGLFMAEVFRHPNPTDPHHGNGSFGAMMLQCAIDAIGQRAPIVAPGTAVSERSAPTFTEAELQRDRGRWVYSTECEAVLETRWFQVTLVPSPPLCLNATLRVVFKAASAREDQPTRFGLQVRGDDGASSGWRWFWAEGGMTIVDGFEWPIPQGSRTRGTWAVAIAPSDGAAEATASVILMSLSVEQTAPAAGSNLRE